MDEIVPTGAQLGHLFGRLASRRRSAFFRRLGDPRFSRRGGKVPRPSIRGDGMSIQTRRGTPRGRRDKKAAALLKNNEEQRRQERFCEKRRVVVTTKARHHHRVVLHTIKVSTDDAVLF